MEQKVLRVSTLMVAGALALRLFSAVAPNISVSEEVASWLIFLQTGRLIRPASIEFQMPDTETIPETTAASLQQSPQTVLTFSEEGAEELAINCSFD